MPRSNARSLSVVVALVTIGATTAAGMGLAKQALAQMPPAQPYPAPAPYPAPGPMPAPPGAYPPAQPAPYLPPATPQPYTPGPAPAPYGQPYPPGPAPAPYPAPPPYPGPAPQPGYAPAPAPYGPAPMQPLPQGPQPPPYGGAPYGQPPPYAPAPYGQPPPYPPAPPGFMPPAVPPAAQPWRDPGRRSDGEMAVLYATTAAYGVGTGIWIDGVAGESDPGLSFIAPILLGGAVPVSVYLADHYYAFHRGVPESISTGLLLGAVEGVAVAGTQYATSSNPWGFGGDATAAFIFSTVGGVGGYAFGEWLRPDSRSLTFIASGGAWGAIAGSEFGAALGGTCPGPATPGGLAVPCTTSSWTNGASIAGLIGYNLGLAGAGALSVKYMPSWRSQAWMWGGFLIGTAASSVVYFAYIGSSDDPRHGLIANSLGGLAGLGIAAALTANMKDDNATNKAVQRGEWKPPFQLAMQPVLSPLYGSTETKGVAMSVSGEF